MTSHNNRQQSIDEAANAASVQSSQTHPIYEMMPDNRGTGRQLRKSLRRVEQSRFNLITTLEGVDNLRDTLVSATDDIIGDYYDTANRRGWTSQLQHPYEFERAALYGSLNHLNHPKYIYADTDASAEEIWRKSARAAFGVLRLMSSGRNEINNDDETKNGFVFYVDKFAARIISERTPHHANHLR